MQLVVDANIVIAVFIKGDFTKKLLFSTRLELISPDFIFEEILKYKEYIIKKAHLSPDDFNKTLEIIRKRLIIIPEDEYSGYYQEAKEMLIDENDVKYLQLALYLNAPIWSNDKDLKKQNRIKVYSTSEVFGLFHK